MKTSEIPEGYVYTDTVDKIAGVAAAKVSALQQSPVRYFFAAALAGIYVGLGIILIFSIGAPLAAVKSPVIKLVMGTSFGIALTLVIIAGSELFTGLNMVMTCGLARKKTRIIDVALIWIVAWLGNLFGSLFIAWLYSQTGFMQSTELSSFVNAVSAQKMSASFTNLFVRGIFCNVLVCLAVWMCFRLTSEAAKLGVIFWCLFAFIASGFEHSIANMTLLAIPLFSVPLEGVTWIGYARNIAIVTAGNILGGALLIGAIYSFISIKKEVPLES